VCVCVRERERQRETETERGRFIHFEVLRKGEGEQIVSVGRELDIKCK
jgi:hypothetical protein